MDLPRHALLCIVLLCAPGAASAQDNKWDKPVDLKPLVLPAVPLPPASQLNPGSVGGSQNPYTTAPLQGPGVAPAQPSAPGLKLTIPR